MQRQLRKVAENAIGHAGVRWAKVEPENKGDGLLLLLPPGVDEPRVIPALVNGLCLALQQANRRALSSRRMRLRMALTQGIRHPGMTGAVGEAVIAAFRLVDSPAVRGALDMHPDRSLAVIVSDDLYNDVVAQKYPGLDPAEFASVKAEVTEKGFAAKAWTHVPVPGDGQLQGPSPLDSPMARRLGDLARDAGMQASGSVLGALAGELMWQHHHAAHAEHTGTGHEGGQHGDDPSDIHNSHDGHHGDITYDAGTDWSHHG
jgi:hypothetical protein